MKRISLIILSTVLGSFGLLTLFMSSSVIFDLFNIRAHEGNYVLFIVWANFFSGILFLTSAFAIVKRKIWSAVPLFVSLGILGVAFAGLLIHINADGAYETKTIGAMIFRMIVSATFALVLYSYTRKLQASLLVKAAMLALLPVAVLVAGCGHRQNEEHNHHAVELDELHHHEGNVGLVALNNGEKWEADEHTLSVANAMKLDLLEFENAGRMDYQGLADSMSRKLSILVAGCTMKGAAHDELHKWLVPVTENVKALAAAHEPTEARAKVSNLKESLRVFDDFFERKSHLKEDSVRRRN